MQGHEGRKVEDYVIDNAIELYEPVSIIDSNTYVHIYTRIHIYIHTIVRSSRVRIDPFQLETARYSALPLR